jgi:histone H3/H4
MRDMKFQKSAIEALQEAVEAYLVGYFEGKDSDYYNDYY